jgi:pyruvate formate lyase activating enzyme
MIFASDPMQGLVFDIKRCAVSDGPGIRTTVFLKGCPLGCLWCHNPESIAHGPQFRYVAQKCAACGQCAVACPRGCHRIDDDGRHVLDRIACAQCGRCVTACTPGAMELVGRFMSVAEVMAVVLRDVRYYAASGGGLTVSGGEPLLQPAFTGELLAEAKRRGIHTCLDTTGQAPAAHLLDLLPYVDLLLYDYKESDPQRHRQYTGVDNRLIVENLRQANARGGRIILRCPIIPRHNDRAEHFEAIARLTQKLDNIVQIDILPFHPLAADKCEQVGREYVLKELAAAGRETADVWLADLQSRVKIPVRQG